MRGLKDVPFNFFVVPRSLSSLRTSEIQKIQHNIRLILIWAEWIRKLFLAVCDYLPTTLCILNYTTGTFSGVPRQGRGSMGKGPHHIHTLAQDYLVFDRRQLWRPESGSLYFLIKDCRNVEKLLTTQKSGEDFACFHTLFVKPNIKTNLSVLVHVLAMIFVFIYLVIHLCHLRGLWRASVSSS